MVWTPLTDLDAVRRLAAERRDEFEVMRHSLELMDERADAEIDAIVEAVAAPIIAAIDCTQCANCCRSLDVYLTPDDADRLAAGIDVPLDTILTGHVDRERAAGVGEWGVLRQKPCVFLRGNLCSIYPHRPDSCRRYPQFTPDFRWTLADTIEGAALCPIIYNVLSAMIPVVDALEAGRMGPPAGSR